MPQVPTLLEMLKAGVHFGHQKAKWHPKMQPFIYTVRHGIHILDLEKTSQQLEAALVFVRGVVAGGGNVLFVSLKQQADTTVREAATAVGMPYIVGRWLGGVFTNWGVISRLIQYLDKLEAGKARGDWAQYTKKEQGELQKDFEKLNVTVAGIRTMTKLPEAMFLIGVKEGKNAVREARRANVPVVAVTDTDTNPTLITHPIPANDDALQSIHLITALVAEAVREGQKQLADQTPAPAAV